METTNRLKKCSTAMSDWLELSTQISLRSHFMFFKEQGISHSQISTLHMLHHNKKLAVNDVSNMLAVSKPAASQLLDLLVKRGFVERYEASEDRRIKYHKLSDKGKKLMKDSHSAKKGWYQSLVDDLSDNELDLVTNALDVLIQKIRVFGPEELRCEEGDGHRC